MATTSAALETGLRTVLSVGSGPESHKDWEAQGYQVIRLDIEPRTNPDICANMTDMGDVGPFDVIFCCHALEHLYPHEVSQALGEFHRVLKPGGTAVILVPDLEGIKPTDDVLPDYPSDCRITGLHLYYGDAKQIPEFPYMAHHCGFVKETLGKAMEAAGFTVITKRLSSYNLMATGSKCQK